MAMNIKKGDTVVVLSGKDKGKQGKVLGTVPGSLKVVVEGINMVTCHVKPRKQGEEGGIMKREAAIAACKVQVVCPKCSCEKGELTNGQTERKIHCRSRSRPDEAVRLQERHADPQDRQGGRERGLR